jgi:bifunctional non-homologous end joining protein LigD
MLLASDSTETVHHAEAAHIKGAAIIDAEVICESDGIADFDTLQSRVHDHRAIAAAFDLLNHDGTDLRPMPLSERKAALKRLLARCSNAIQYVIHLEGDGAEMFAAVCKLGLEGIVSKRSPRPTSLAPRNPGSRHATPPPRRSCE